MGSAGISGSHVESSYSRASPSTEGNRRLPVTNLAGQTDQCANEFVFRRVVMLGPVHHEDRVTWESTISEGVRDTIAPRSKDVKARDRLDVLTVVSRCDVSVGLEVVG
jgi:hypothetical protein